MTEFFGVLLITLYIIISFFYIFLNVIEVLDERERLVKEKRCKYSPASINRAALQYRKAFLKLLFEPPLWIFSFLWVVSQEFRLMMTVEREKE